jgi:predicted GNAT family acetyltransferase
VTGPDAGDLQVVDEPEQQRYVARLGGRVVGFAEYRNVRDRTILFHTEVEPSVEGRGVGSRLAAGVLDDLRARGRRVTIKCPFIAAYVARHPEYADLQTEAEAARRTRNSAQPPG